jgi:predicted nucleic acid-binding protein
MEVLVDTSIWIDYFRGDGNSEHVDFLIDENLLVTNELILAELLPFLRVKKQERLIDLLQEINMTPLDIRWNEIIDYQVRCLEDGANGIGIPDLIIAQNAIQNGSLVYTLDKHFRLMNETLNVQLYQSRG